MLIRLLCAHEMTNHVCNRFKFQAVAKKTAKNVRGYFILPHPVHITITADLLNICGRYLVTDINMWPIWTLPGIRTFCSPVFSLLGAKVPSGNLRSREQKFPGTFAPENECSQKLSFPGVSSLHDHDKGCLQYADVRRCSESKLEKI